MFKSICKGDETDDFDFGVVLSRNQVEEQEEENSAEIKSFTPRYQQLPELKSSDWDRFPIHPIPKIRENFVKAKRKYGLKFDPKKSFFKRGFNNLRVLPKNQRIVESSTVKFLGSEIHQLFPQAENGPLSIVFSFMNPLDVFESVMFVSKLFHQMSLRYFDIWMSPRWDDLKILFGWRKCLPESLCLRLLNINKFVDEYLPMGLNHYERGNNDSVTYVTFAFFHGYSKFLTTLITDKRCNKHLKICKNDFACASDMFEDKILLKLFQLKPEFTLDKEIQPKAVKAFLYKKNLEGIDLMESRMQNENKSRLRYLYQTKFVMESVFLDYDPERTEKVIKFLTSEKCKNRFEFRKLITEEDFMEYFYHMDEENIVMLLEKYVKPEPKFGVKYVQHFIDAIRRSEKLSIDQKRKIMFRYILNDFNLNNNEEEEGEEDKQPIDTCFRFDLAGQGFQLVYFILEYGTDEEIINFFAKRWKPDQQQLFDFQTLVKENVPKEKKYEQLEMILHEGWISLNPKYLLQFIPFHEQLIKNRRQHQAKMKEDNEFVDILLRHFKFQSNRHQQHFEDLCLAALNQNASEMMRKFLSIKGFRVSERIVCLAIKNFKTLDVVTYLFDRLCQDYKLYSTNEKDNLNVHNFRLVAIFESINIFPRVSKRYKSILTRIVKDMKKFFVPTYKCMTQLPFNNLKKEIWKNYNPRTLKDLVGFLYDCLQYPYVSGISKGKAEDVLKGLVKKKFWRGCFSLYLFYEGRINELENFRSWCPGIARDIQVVCFHCKKVIFVNRQSGPNQRCPNYGWYGGEFRKCANRRCCAEVTEFKRTAILGDPKTEEEVGKVVCMECSKVVLGRNFCLPCFEKMADGKLDDGDMKKDIIFRNEVV